MVLITLKKEIENIKEKIKNNIINKKEIYSILILELCPKTKEYLNEVIKNSNNINEYNFLFNIWIDIQEKIPEENLSFFIGIFYNKLCDFSDTEIKYNVDSNIMT